MTAIRIVVSGATTAIVRRTTMRKAFLGPWHPMVNDIWLYALAYAQQRHEVAVHLTTLVPSHHHTDVTPSKDNLPAFTHRLHHDVSCALNTLLRHERYDAPHELFDDRSAHYMRLLDAPAQASHLLYEYLNPVAAGLVQRPEHMPGRTFDFGLWKTGFIEVERPPVYFGNSRPERLRLELTPPPLLYRIFDGDLDRLIYHMNRLAEGGLRALRQARTRPVMGAKALSRLHPWSEPRTLREPGGRPVPTFRIGASGIVGRLARIDAAREVYYLRNDHEEARIARRDGDMQRLFPFGTYAMRVVHGAPVEPQPPEHAVIARPGPLLCDVKAELLRAEHDRAARRAESEVLLDEVGQAFAQEACEIVEHTDLELLKPTRGEPARGADSGDHSCGDSARAPAVVRQRFDRTRQGDPARGPARIITLRDRRRGRPPREGPRHGSDPPG